jgi:putative hydrolase of the HAD superfamily
MRIDAVMFDLDDTLTDWHGAIGAALAEVATSRGFSVAHVGEIGDILRRFVCVERDGRIVDRQHWRLATAQEPWVEAGCEDLDALVVDFREALLPKLRMHEDFVSLDGVSARWRVGMLTNNPYARSALEEQGHLARFEAVFMAEEPYRKPHSRAFEQAAKLMRCEPAGLVYVGDSIENDIEGALAAGWTPIWIDRFDDGYETPGVTRISTLHDLLPALERLCEPG